MIMVALMLFGILSYGRLGVGQLPDVDFPIASVSLAWEGAAPEVMETDVVDIVEDAIMGIQGVRDISSSIRQGSASITVEFELDRNIDIAVQDIKAKIDAAQKRLPSDLDPPIVTKVNPSDHPILMISIASATRSSPELMTYVQDHVKDRFTTIKGVGDIFFGGFVDRNMRIWIDADKLNASQLTVQDVINAVQAEHEEKPAGRIETPANEYNVRVMGEALNPDQFATIVIPSRAGLPVYKPIYIKDIGTTEDGLADIRRIARSMGKQIVGMGILKQRGANEIDVAHRALKRLEEIKKTLPDDIEMEVRYNRAKSSEDAINELLFTLVLSAIATSLVCWLFLGSWTATLNILLAIPTSVLGTFLVIYFLGFTLNTFTVLGLSLAIGIVVDDAIMVLENIVRWREKGTGKVEAARKGARQITFAALAATIALIAIFLPVAFMTGIIGRFFFQYGVTITVAVALSLVEALTLAPMRCSQFLVVGERGTAFGKMIDGSFKKLARGYRAALGRIITRPVLTLFVAFVFFISSLFFFRFLRKEFVPSQDISILLCSFRTPEGSSIDVTSDRIKQAESVVMTRPEVKGYVAIIGGFSGGEVNTGMMFITFKDPKRRPVVPPARHRLSQNELMAIFRAEFNKIPDVKAFVQDISLMGFSAQRGSPIEFSIRGPDWERLAGYAQEIQSRMGQSKLMTDVDTDYQAKIPEIQVFPDREKAEARGVSIDVIGNAVNAMIGGQKIGKYTKDGRRYDVRVRLVPSQRTRFEDIQKLWVWNNRGELVQLKDVVTIEQKPKPLTITRRNRERAISIFANVAQGESQAKALQETEKIAKEVLPAGYRIVFSGSTQAFKESISDLILALVLGIIVAYMVLASQFNSFVHPFTVLLALPFSVSGAFIALLLGRQSFNIYSFIGLILLMGIVKKNSILLVDFTNKMREQQLPVREAILKACPIRLRPILMTSVATITAALPPALAIGPGAETRVPMAITIIGGVMVSTFLTLFVVPCGYLLLSKVEHKKYEVAFQDEGEIIVEDFAETH